MEPPLPQHPSRTALPEHRWPAVAMLLLALALYALLPPGQILGPQRYLVVAFGIALIVPLVAVNPHRLTRQTKWSRAISVAFALGLVITNQATLLLLIIALVSGGRNAPGGLLLGALQVWVVNVIGFTTLFWELDRGGPVIRTTSARAELPPADFRFPQDEDDDAVAEVAAGSSAIRDWTPRFVDYFYSTLSNSMAFSATDAMPLSPRFKLLMALQRSGAS